MIDTDTKSNADSTEASQGELLAASVQKVP